MKKLRTILFIAIGFFAIGVFSAHAQKATVVVSVSDITQMSAILNGQYTSYAGAPIKVHWGIGSSLSAGYSPFVSPSGAFTLQLTGLLPNTTYTYRVENMATGQWLTEPQVFSTLRPTVILTQGEITESSALFFGEVSPGLPAIAVYVAKNPLAITTHPFVLAPNNEGKLFALATNLEPATTYYYRAANLLNPLVTYGDMKTFTTLAPTMVVSHTLNGTSVTITGEVDPGTPPVKVLLSNNPFHFKNEQNPVTTNNVFNATFSGLAPNAVYFYKIVKRDSPGIVYVTKTFTTPSSNVLVNYQGLTHESVQFYGERMPGGPNIVIRWGKDEANIDTVPASQTFEPIFVDDHFTYVLPNLESNTTYFFSVVDKNTPSIKYVAGNFRTLNPPIIGTGGSGSAGGYSPTVDEGESLIPCGRNGQPSCNFAHFIELLNRFIRFLLFTIATPLAAVLFAYAGWLYMTSGSNPGNRSTAKKIFIDVFAGFVIALAAFLIIKALLAGLGYTGTTFLAP